MRAKVSASLLASDFARLADEIRRAESGGADWLHIDVMDGVFVNNITVGPPIVKAVKRETRLPLDVHLMITRPARYLEAFVSAGADWVTIHEESQGVTRELLREIRALGARPGLTVRPGTGLETFREHRDLLDLALLMSVEPGFGGQALLPGSLERVARVRAVVGDGVEVSVDGGVTGDNARGLREAGVSVIVAGTAVFGADNLGAAVAALQGT